MSHNKCKQLDGQVALITGGVRRIGAATALALADEGANIVINARSSRAEGEALVEVLRARGVKAMLYLADVTDEQAVDDMVDSIIKEYGRLDILMNNAANRAEAAFTEMTLAEWREIISVILHIRENQVNDRFRIGAKSITYRGHHDAHCNPATWSRVAAS